MTEDQDNAGEVVAATVRVALTAAGQFAEQAARRRAAALREAERESTARTAAVQSQMAAERALALRSAHDVLRRGATMTMNEVVEAWQQVAGWDDPVVAADRKRLEDLVRDRFGVDVRSLDGSGGVAPQVTSSTERDRVTAAALVGRDTEQRASDSHLRTGAPGGGVGAVSAPAGVEPEVVEAWALAAQSHPTSPALATQPPVSGTRPRRRGPQRRPGAEVIQGPGR